MASFSIIGHQMHNYLFRDKVIAHCHFVFPPMGNLCSIFIYVNWQRTKLLAFLLGNSHFRVPTMQVSFESERQSDGGGRGGVWFDEQVCCFVYLIKVLKLLPLVLLMTILSLFDIHCKLQVHWDVCQLLAEAIIVYCRTVLLHNT
jgi:hypothetical protein